MGAPRVNEQSPIDIAVISFTGDTGLTDYSASLCNELAKRCHVALVTAESFDEKKYKASYPVHKIFRRTRHYPIDFPKFICWSIVSRPRVIIFQSWLKYPAFELAFVLLLRAFGIRVALTVHDLLPHYPRPWSKWVLSHFYQAFSHLIVHSNAQLQGIRDMGVETPALTVPHGVYDIFNTRELTKIQAREFIKGISPDAFVVLFFGHLDERKGIVEFLDAARRMHPIHSDIVFLVAGKSDGRERVVQALKRGVAEEYAVIHEGRVEHDDVQQYFTAADLVALPYLEGTTSGVMKLAMAFKKPVICTGVGDFDESLKMWAGQKIQGGDIALGICNAVIVARDNMQNLSSKADAVADGLTWASISEKYKNFVSSRI
jgi:glycosyltransferase involved in cell wall biosynthesis